MTITPVNSFADRQSFGYMDIKKPKRDIPQATLKDKILAGAGSSAGVGIVLGTMMTLQKRKNPLHLKYGVKEMLTMAVSGNAGGILLSSIGEAKEDKKKKWKEGAFQMLLTSVPMLSVDGIIKLCEKSKKKIINNNFMKILASIGGVYAGSHTALWVSNKLRNDQEAKKPERKLKLVDMIANLDDAVAIMILAKVPFADKIHVERLLPFIYSFCGYRSGTGDRR